MESAAEQVLNSLHLLDKTKSTLILKELKLNVSTYIGYFPKSTSYHDTHQDCNKIDEYLYGKVLDRLITIMDTCPIIDDILISVVNEIMVMNYMPFPVFHELLMVMHNCLKKLTNKKALEIIMRTSGNVLKSNVLYSVIIDISRNYKESDKHYSIIEENWKNFLQLLISLPSKIANKMQDKNLEICFTLDIYTKLLTYHISRAILFLHNEYQRFNIKYEVNMISSMISKSMFALGSNKFIDLIFILQNWSLNRHKNMQPMIQDILCHIERNSTEPIAVLLLKSIEDPQKIKDIFGNVLNITNWNYVLTTKIPLLSYYSDEKLIMNLVFYLSHFQNDNDTLMNMLVKLLETWSKKSALNHTRIEQHEFISKLIIMSVKILEHSLNSARINQIKQLLFDGTFIHLSSVQIEIRAIGMITSELVIAYLNKGESGNVPALHFDYDEMPSEGKVIIEDFKIFSNNITRALNTSEPVLIDEKSLDIGNEKLSKIGVDCGILQELEKTETTSDFDNECNKTGVMPVIATTLQEQKTKENLVSDNDCNDIDSDDDLIPYDTCADKKTSEKLRPVYLRDLKDIIGNSTANDDPDIFAESMIIAEDLILSQLPHDDSSFAIELLKILLTKQEQSYVENFEILKFNACVAIVLVYPKQCAEFLCEQFHSENTEFGISQRLYFLDVLGAAATKLSTINIQNNNNEAKVNSINFKKQNKKYIKSPLFINISSGKKYETLYDEEFEITSTNSNDNNRNWQEIIEKRIQSNTRRFAHEAKYLQATLNKFNDVAYFFFFPLIYGISLNTYICKIPQHFSDEKNLLLTRFLKTLSVIILAAENCVIAPKMALASLELVWSLRYHEEASVRLMVIKNVASTVVILSKQHFSIEILNLLIEFRTWLEEISLNSIRGDPDAYCRNLGQHVISLIDSILTPIIQ